MSDLQGRAKEIFLKALNQTGDLEAFVAGACGGEEALQQRVQALLKAHLEAGEFLPPSNLDATMDSGNVLPASNLDATFDSGGPNPAEMTQSHNAAEPEPSRQIGPYKLLEEIGEGGMGTVWVAQQSEPIKRKVAIKLIKAGMDSQQVLARFEAERQALAMMDHPNIARVVDAGMTEQGRPYFAMEYVKGVPLTEYCDHAKLSIKDRLELFLPICNAVQHAHQKGIIHRDLKPSNILICLYDGKPVPKVIDFGLAKAMHQSLTDRTLHTRHGMMIGTPLYMSPEQAESNNLDIDTRTDIYSLGVILYELLTGSTPLEKAQLKEAVFLEVLRLIKEVEPPKPSMRLSGSESLPSVAAQRSVEPSHLARSVTGDLDWVVMKALEKERGRRYETANGLAEDIRRHLSDEPVSASPPSAKYRMQKFVKRNKGPVMAASLLLVSLLAGIGGTTWGLLEANRQAAQKDDALQAETTARKEAERQTNLAIEAREKESEANAKAQQRAEGEQRARLDAEAVTDFVVDDFLALTSVRGQVLRPKRSEDLLTAELTKDTTLRELLDRAAQNLDLRKDLPPLIEARLRNIIGRSYYNNGDAAKCVPFLLEALKLRQRELGTHSDTLTSMDDLALAYREVGQLGKSIQLHEEILELTKAKQGSDHLATIMAMHDLAYYYREARQLDKALPLFEKTLERRKAKLGLDHPHTLTVMLDLASAYREAGRRDKAISLNEVLKFTEVNWESNDPGGIKGINKLNLAGDMHMLAMRYEAAGLLDKAIPLLEETLELRKEKLGSNHPDTLTSVHGLAFAYDSAGQLDQAIPLLEETLELRKARLGSNHPDTLSSMNNLAYAYERAGHLDKALSLNEKTLELKKAKLGMEHSDTLQTMDNLAYAYERAGHLDKALSLYEKTLELKKAKLGPHHPDTLTSLANLAGSYGNNGKRGKALELYERALELVKAGSDGDPTGRIEIQTNLAKIYDQMGQSKKAMTLTEEALKLSRAELGDDHPTTLEALETIAVGHYRLGELEKSIPLFEELLKTREKKVGRQHPSTLMTIENLGVNYMAANRLDEALPLLEEAYKVSKTYPSLRGSSRRASSLTAYYLKMEQFDKALLVVRKTLADSREQFGDDHPETLQSLGALANVAVAVWENGHLEKSVPLFEELLELHEEMLGRYHPQTLYTMVNLAVNYRDAARFDEALPLLEEVYEHGMEDSEDSAWVRDELLETYAKAGQFDKLLELANEQLAMARKTLPPNSPELAGKLAQYGSFNLEAKAYAEAEAAFLECLAIREKDMADSWLTFNTQSMLGGALLGQQKYKDAEPLLLKGYQGMKEREQSMPGAARIRLTEALERLVRLYQATDNEEQATKWQAELEKRQPDNTPAEQETGKR